MHGFDLLVRTFSIASSRAALPAAASGGHPRLAVLGSRSDATRRKQSLLLRQAGGVERKRPTSNKAGQPAATRPEDLCGIVGAGGRWRPAGRSALPAAHGKAQPLGILTSAVVVLGEKVLAGLAREW
jgi:hypothetical protein